MTETINSILAGKDFSPPNRSNHKPEDSQNPTVHLKKENHTHSIFNLEGIQRLNVALANEQPLRNNVPRGYYLNILV